jgi:hypothetical protein
VYDLVVEYSVRCDSGVIRPKLDDLADGIIWDPVAVGFATVLGNDTVADSLRKRTPLYLSCFVSCDEMWLQSSVYRTWMSAVALCAPLRRCLGFVCSLLPAASNCPGAKPRAAQHTPSRQ